jgi:hypothetical protein
MEPILQPGDVFLTRGRNLVSRAIRFFSRGVGERRTVVNHVGLFVEGGTLRTAYVVEALSKVRCHPLWRGYGPPSNTLVAVYRPDNLNEEEIGKIVEYARKQVGRRYAFGTLLAHLADWALLGSYFFRRLTKDGKYPICSWLVAHAFKQAGKDFGVPEWAAQPDDIWDFVRKETDKYSEVYPLGLLS